MMDSQENALVEEQNVNEVAVAENAEQTEVTEVAERKQYQTKQEVLERVQEIAHSDETPQKEEIDYFEDRSILDEWKKLL